MADRVDVALNCPRGDDRAVLAHSSPGHLAHGDQRAMVAHGEGGAVGGADDRAVLTASAA